MEEAGSGDIAYTIPIPYAFDEANALQRFLRRFAAYGPGSWLFAHVLHRIDVPLYRASRGRVTVAGALAGLPVVMLTTTGARSGLPRTVPVLGLPTSDGLAVIGSNYGQHHTPSWVHNLRAHPEVIASVRGRRAAMRAVLAEDDLRARIWEQGLRIYPGFGQYERRAAHRTITVWVLEPTDSPVPE
jgi:deazaflavin-dependent oxidoreductase (nitroreductase family)